MNSQSKDLRVSPNIQQISIDPQSGTMDGEPLLPSISGDNKFKASPQRVQELISRYNLNNLKMSLNHRANEQASLAIGSVVR
jgi:hypothetical protein